jgi:hypothetical protein
MRRWACAVGVGMVLGSGLLVGCSRPGPGRPPADSSIQEDVEGVPVVLIEHRDQADRVRACYQVRADSGGGSYSMDTCVPHGSWVAWHADGSLAEVGRYRNGNRHGRWLFFNAEGTRVRAAVYVDGVAQE